MFFILDFLKMYLLQQLRHQNTFQHLIQNLPLIYRQRREEITIKKYQQYFKTWKEWVCFLPAEPMYVVLYLLSKMQASHTYPTMDALFYVIKFFHKSLLNVDPCSHFFVTNMFEAVLRCCGFMRFSKVSRLSRSDYIFSSTYVKVFIEKSKADIYREGMWLYITASSKICRLKQLKYYVALSKISENSEEFIFRGLSRDKKGSLRTKNTPMSYSRI